MGPFGAAEVGEGEVVLLDRERVGVGRGFDPASLPLGSEIARKLRHIGRRGATYPQAH
jgi:hypothetical protein